jgi:hypothetical protein
MSKTAVNWLDEQIKKHTWYDEEGFGYVKVSSLDIEQAKAMEKEQMGDVWDNGMKSDNGHFGTFEIYYNKTYGK